MRISNLFEERENTEFHNKICKFFKSYLEKLVLLKLENKEREYNEAKNKFLKYE